MFQFTPSSKDKKLGGGTIDITQSTRKMATEPVDLQQMSIVLFGVCRMVPDGTGHASGVYHHDGIQHADNGWLHSRIFLCHLQKEQRKVAITLSDCYQVWPGPLVHIVYCYR